MIKINRKSKEGIKKKIASFSLLALLFNATMIGVFVPSENVLNACHGKITIAKVTIPSGSNQEFEFTGDLGNFDLKDGKSESFTKTPGTYTVTESLNGLNDWKLLSIVCAGDDEVNINNKNAVIELDNKEDVVCTFTNCKDANENDICDNQEAELGSITVCKIIVDEKGDIVDGDENAGTFLIPGISSIAIPDTSFITPLTLNESIIENNDAQCVTYDNLSLGSYWYGEEVITGSNWLEPKYNDQFTDTITTLDDFYEYEEPGNNQNADGNIVLSSSRPDRTLVVLNEYEAPTDEVTIVASKVICDNEEDLPNWGLKEVGEDITENTAIEYVAQHSGCHLAEGWSFQVGDATAVKKDGDFYEEASTTENWTTFGQTDTNGKVETTVDISNIASSQLRLREVLQKGYIPFTYPPNDNDISAEFYCHTDVYKYDNYDYINNPIAGETYYCVAFNAPIESNCTDKDKDGYAVEGRECGLIDCNDDDSSINPGATEICGNDIDEDCDGVIEDCYCDPIMARVVIDETENIGVDNQIYVGSKTNIYASGEWFPIYENGAFINNDDDIVGYENVSGLAIQRTMGTIRAVLYRGENGAFRHINGYIEFYNASVNHLRDDNIDSTNDNRLENDVETGGYNDSDGTKDGAGDDEVWIEDNKSHFWLGVTTGDDGYYTDYSSLPLDECKNSFCESKLRVDITYFANFGEDSPDISDNVYVENSLFGQSVVTIPLTTNNRADAIIDALTLDNDDIPGLHVQRGENSTGSYFEISAYGFNHGLTRESIKANTQLINATIISIDNGPSGGYENPLDGICGITEGNAQNDLPGNDEYNYVSGANAGKMCSITNVHRDRIRVYYEPTEECGIYCGNNTKEDNEECDDGNNIDGDGCSAICTTETPKYGPYCGDGIVNQDWEECDNNNPSTVGCSAQCQIMGNPECSEDVFTRIVVTDVQNEGNNADMTNDIYLGTDVLPIPHNTWFAVHYNDSYLNDSDIDTYQDVSGLAVQRLDGQVRVQIYGSHSNDGTQEHIEGYLEFFNAETINPLINDTSPGNKMEGSDWDTTIPDSTTPITAGRDYAWIDGDKSHFWMTVTTANDGYFTPYEVPVCEDPICSIFGHKYDKTGIGLVDWVIGLAQIIDCIADEEWADSVVSYSPVGTIVDERDDPEQALDATDYDETNGTYNFVSLGIGGELILEFDNLILNGTGDDIEVVETSWESPTCAQYTESARVEASQDGTTWIVLGEQCINGLNHNTFDLGTLEWAKYVKIVDTTPTSSASTDGYDVDAVRALHCGNYETVISTTTDASGEYCFADVDAGDYILYEEMQDGWEIWKVLVDQVLESYSVDSFFDVFVEIEVVDGETTTVDFYNQEDDVPPENIPPVADAGIDQTVLVNTVVDFDGSGSTDSDGTIVSYDWDFDDGNTGTGIAPTNTYTATGTYDVELTVTDDDGATDTDIVQIIIEDGNNPVEQDDVIINEIMWTGNSGEPNDQWIELKNVSDEEQNLKGCQLKYHKDTGNENKIAYLSDSIDTILNSGTFYLVSHYTESTSHINSIDPGLSGTADVNNFEYNEFQIKLYCPDATGALVEIDAVGDAVNPPTFGDNNDPKRSMKKCGSEWETALDEESGTTYNWDDTAEEKGTPGSANVCENNFVCTDGDTEPCYSGPDGTEGIGICHGGERTCTNNVWGACEEEVTPQNEICGNGIDEDCNGADTNCSSGGGGGSAIITKPSIRITNEKVIYLGAGDALVTWTTNIETTRQVAYGDDSISALDVAPEYGYDSVNTESTDMTKEHSVTISGLTDGIPYYFRPIADRNGSTGEVVGVEVFYEVGEVKGIEAPIPTECNYLLEYIKLGADNNPIEVKKLEWFLNEFEGENLAINGIYEQVDFDAVSRFQERYLEDILSPWSHTEATGYVYITTKKKINELYCEREFPLTEEQKSEISRFSAMFYALTGGAVIPPEYNIFSPENDYTEEETSEYSESETGEVAGDKDEDETGTETETETGDKPENEEETEGLTDEGTLLVDGDTEDDIVYDDNGYPDYYFWIVVILLILIIGTIYYLTNIRRKPTKIG